MNNEVKPTATVTGARDGISSVNYDCGASNSPTSHTGRLSITFSGESGRVDLEQIRHGTRRRWSAALPASTWLNLLDTLIGYGFPRPIADDGPLLPDQSTAMIRWVRRGETEEVFDSGRTADYADVRGIVFSVVEQMAPGLLGIPAHFLTFPNSTVEGAKEVT